MQSKNTAWALSLALGMMLTGGSTGRAAQPQAAAAAAEATQLPSTPGVLFNADQLNALLPQTVYFQGRTAPLQLRNAAGMRFAPDEIVWVSLVDSSGYATSVQEKYQFYLVTEGPLRVNGASLPAGAYGGGFVGDHFLIMDLGGHTLAQGPVQTEAALMRPRPLQLQVVSPSRAKLLLGRRSVTLDAGA